jgi:methyl-accepting chemotaxis protein
MQDRETKTRHLVEAAQGVLQYFEQQERTGSLPRAQAQAQAIETLRRMRYEGSEYFWINDLEPRMLLQPASPELEGKDLASLRDGSGRPLFALINGTARDGGGLVRYDWPKPGRSEPQPKISYVVLFQPWAWVLGSGIYVDDVEQLFHAEALQALLIMAGLLMLMLVANYFLSSSITRPIEECAAS